MTFWHRPSLALTGCLVALAGSAAGLGAQEAARSFGLTFDQSFQATDNQARRTDSAGIT